jgi:hypothetical protein
MLVVLSSFIHQDLEVNKSGSSSSTYSDEPNQTKTLLSPLSFSDGLNFVRFGFCRKFDGGHQLLLLPPDLLFFNLDLLATLDNLKNI